MSNPGDGRPELPSPAPGNTLRGTLPPMGYLRLWRRKTIAPGVRLNLSKSGLSWSLGPRGAHFTVGPHGTRRTVGIPGTGVHYTSYSGYQAHRAAGDRAAPVRAVRQSSAQAGTSPVLVHRDPMLPTTKIVLGVILSLIGVATIIGYVGVLFLIPGAILIAVGLTQRNKPEWRVRVLLRHARGQPPEAEALLGRALVIDNDNPEALAANADWRFDNHQWAAAADLFERYLTHAPDDWLAEGHAANAWLNAGNADAAIPHFLHVREKPFLTDDSRASVTAGLAMAYLHKGDPKQALELARSAPLQRHNLGEGLQQCLFLRALAAYLAGQHSRAISDMDRLAGINPTFPNIDEVRNEMLTGTFKLETNGLNS
jgi:Flp pilus assembly protein TadD